MKNNDMKKYDKDATCRKCGHGGIEDLHEDAESQHNCNLVNNIGRALGETPREPIPERIARTCKNCGYLWDEAPLNGFDACVDVFMEAAAKSLCVSVDDLLKEFSTKKGTAPATEPDRPDSKPIDSSTSEAIREAIGRQGGQDGEDEEDTDWLKRLYAEARDAHARQDSNNPAIKSFKIDNGLHLDDVHGTETIREHLESLDDPGGVKATCDAAKVETQVFEVGDLVKRNSLDKCRNYQCKVLHKNIAGELSLRSWNGPGLACTCICDVMPSLVLIQKAPKVHTFKSVKWDTAKVHHAPELKRHSPFVGWDNFDTFEEVAESGKTYTLTLTEQD